MAATVRVTFKPDVVAYHIAGLRSQIPTANQQGRLLLTAKIKELEKRLVALAVCAESQAIAGVTQVNRVALLSK